MTITADKSLSLIALAARVDAATWPPIFRYSAAFAIVAFATLLHVCLPLDNAAFLLYMPGMFVTGFLFGRGPGYFAVLLSAFIAICIFASPSSEEFFGTTLYATISLAMVTVCDLFRHVVASRESDLTDIRAANQALEKSETFLRSVLQSSPDCIKILDMEGRLQGMNEHGKLLMEIDDFKKIEGSHWPDFWKGSDNDQANAALVEAKGGNIGRFQGFCETMAGTPRWWDVAVSPVMGIDGKPEKLLSVSRDITDQKRAEAQQQLLNHELGHRIKNTLAMIQAIANQTMRRAPSLAEARIAFDARLIALGKAQDVLTDTKWESAEIDAIVRNALLAHDLESGRFTISGPSLILSSRCSLALSLALHELATNAAKYGALSNEAGTIAIDWMVKNDENEALRFTLQWRETGGPAVHVPKHTGFGSFMIERSLSAYFKGTARIEYRETGVVFTLEGPVTRSDAKFQTGTVDILARRLNFNDRSGVNK